MIPLQRPRQKLGDFAQPNTHFRQTRPIEHWGRLSSETMTKLDEALKISLGLVLL